MAAIIAQLTLANRERKKRALKHIGCTKCNYTLQPFDTNGFNAKVHNRYILERERFRVMCVQNEQEEQVLQDIYTDYLVSLALDKVCGGNRFDYEDTSKLR